MTLYEKFLEAMGDNLDNMDDLEVEALYMDFWIEHNTPPTDLVNPIYDTDYSHILC